MKFSGKITKQVQEFSKKIEKEILAGNFEVIGSYLNVTQIKCCDEIVSIWTAMSEQTGLYRLETGVSHFENITFISLQFNQPEECHKILTSISKGISEKEEIAKLEKRLKELRGKAYKGYI